MPMKWTPENDQILLLKILETSQVSVDHKEIAERWPDKGDGSKPTPRAITERLVKIREQCRASGGGGFSVSSAQSKKPRSLPATPRKPRTKKEPTSEIKPEAKPETEGENPFAYVPTTVGLASANRSANHSSFEITATIFNDAPISNSSASDLPELILSSATWSGTDASQPPTPSNTNRKRRYDVIKTEGHHADDDELYRCDMPAESLNKKAKAASFAGPFNSSDGATVGRYDGYDRRFDYDDGAY